MFRFFHYFVVCLLAEHGPIEHSHTTRRDKFEWGIGIKHGPLPA